MSHMRCSRLPGSVGDSYLSAGGMISLREHVCSNKIVRHCELNMATNPYHALLLVRVAETRAFMCMTKISLNAAALSFAAKGYDVNLPAEHGHISPERLRVAAQVSMLLLGIPRACLQSYTKLQTFNIHITPMGQELPANMFSCAAAGTPSNC